MTEFEEFDKEIADLKEYARKTNSCCGCENFYKCWVITYGEAPRNNCIDHDKWEPNDTIRTIIGEEIYLKHKEMDENILEFKNGNYIKYGRNL